MSKYRVGFFYGESGVTEVEAKTKEEAEEKIEEYLEENGIDGLQYKVTDREYSIN